MIEGWINAFPGGDVAVCAAVLAAIFIAASVLDAYAIIFVAVPILIPPLLVRIPDAVWVAALVLLTLQASFLLPPVGCALLMTLGLLGSEAPFGTFARSLAPFLAGQALVMVLTLGCPRIVHLLEPPDAQARGIVGPAVSPQEVEKKLLEMLPPPPLPGIEKSGIEKLCPKPCLALAPAFFPVCCLTADGTHAAARRGSQHLCSAGRTSASPASRKLGIASWASVRPLPARARCPIDWGDRDTATERLRLPAM